WSSAVSGRRLWFPYAFGAGLILLGGVLGGLAGPVPGAGVLAIGQDIVLRVWCWTVADGGRIPAHAKARASTWWLTVCRLQSARPWRWPSSAASAAGPGWSRRRRPSRA